MKPNKELTLEELKKQGYQFKEQDTFMMKDGKLDIKSLEEKGLEGQASVPTDDGWKNVPNYDFEETLKDGIHIYISGDSLSGYSKQITKKDDLITTSYGYYASGSIKNIGDSYPNRFNKGTSYWYNERGQINRLEEYDKPYKYTWEDVLLFMQEKEIKKEDIQHIRREVKKEKHTDTPYWYIAKVTARDGLDSPTSALQYTLDGNTGKVLKEEVLDVTRHLE